jgi:hypothetical protein
MSIFSQDADLWLRKYGAKYASCQPSEVTESATRGSEYVDVACFEEHKFRSYILWLNCEVATQVLSIGITKSFLKKVQLAYAAGEMYTFVCEQNKNTDCSAYLDVWCFVQTCKRFAIQ